MDLPAKYGEPSFKKKKLKKLSTLKKFFFAQSPKSAKWTCLPNMVSLAKKKIKIKKMDHPKKIFYKSL